MGKATHAINGEKGLTFCGREPDAVVVSNGQEKITCKTCLRVVDKMVQEKITCKTCLRVVDKMVQEMEKRERMENAVPTFELEGLTPLDRRVPALFTEVKFQGLAEHHINALLTFFGCIPSMPEELNDLDVLDSVQMIGVRDKLANIKMEMQAAWACVRTVRGQQCPKNLLQLRELEDEVIAARALTKFVKLGLITEEDLSWAFHVADLFGEVTSGLDEDNKKRWEANKKRDRKLVSNDLDHPELVDLDDPVDRVHRTKSEAQFTTTEGMFGQVQVLCDLDHELKYDLWLEPRVNKRTGEPYGDPKRNTKAAILACVRELFDRTFEVRGNRLVWGFRGFGVDKELTAAATRSKHPRAPWKVALPLEMVYRHMGAKDDRFQELLNLVKDVLMGRTKIKGRVNWKTRQRMVRMWHVLEGNEFMPKFLIINIWIHKDEEWRVALGLPSAPAPARIPPASHRPPKVNGSADSLPKAAG